MTRDASEAVTGKTVLLCVCGGIAAYKSCSVVRGLQKAGVHVKVCMTRNATEFVGPLTFRSLTHEPVSVDSFADAPDDPIHHISLAAEADCVVVAPATANIIAKMAQGIADDLMSTTLLATTAPILVAPAMNVHMYEDEATQANLATLRERGIGFIEAGEGYQACGDVGKGRMAEPDVIVEACLATLGIARDLQGLRVLITAGPTREAIDAVRYISNHSSGKMGYALAEAAALRGADVTLVSGPVSLPTPAGVRRIDVVSADAMAEATTGAFGDCDVAICTAAVADMKPAESFDRKLKKSTDADALSTISLVANPDILAGLGTAKRDDQTVVGFAAETDDLISNAEAKLQAKQADLIVANIVGPDTTFGADESEVWLIDEDGRDHITQRSKFDIATAVLDRIVRIRG